MTTHFKFNRFLGVSVLTLSSLGALTAFANVEKPTSNISTAQHKASADQQKSFRNESVFESGVISLGGNYEQSYGFEALIASYLGASRQQAFAFEFNGGPKLFRENLTYGLALTQQQRIKLTYERLDEKQDFDFHSGKVTRWNGQNAIGGDYAYMLQSDWIERLGFGGYFTHAASKDLGDADYKVDSQHYTETRRIAGARSMNIHSDTAVRLWPQSRLSGGLDYDNVHFNTKYDNHNANTHGLGGHVQLEQRVLPQVKLTTQSHLQTNEQSYGGSVGWLLPTALPMELVATTNYINNKATKNHFFHNGLRMNVALNGSDHTHTHEYTDLNRGVQQSLLDWTRVPAVRMSTVLTTADYKNNLDYFTAPDPSALHKTGGTAEFGGGDAYDVEGWSTENSGQYGHIFSNKGVRFVQVLINGDKATAVYFDENNNFLFLNKSNTQKADDNNWDGNQCVSSNVEDCHLKSTV